MDHLWQELTQHFISASNTGLTGLVILLIRKNHSQSRIIAELAQKQSELNEKLVEKVLDRSQ